MRQALFLFLFLVAGFAFARTSEVCPKLPANSGLEWTYQEGPDFDACYAMRPGTEETSFGIYIGNHPSFDPSNATAVGESKVGGQLIKWYPNANKADAQLSRQSILVLSKEGHLFAHIWVVAKTQKELENYISILEKISFGH